MKTIYNYLLLLLFLLPLVTACDDGGEKIVNMEYEGRSITVVKISPTSGYVGEEMTISGTNFGISKELIKVFIGEDETEILSCEDEEIIIKVPEAATTGKISVKILNENVESEFLYIVLGKPSVTSIEPMHGFVGDQISLIGSNFGSNTELVKAIFPGTETPATVISCENEKIVIEVPEEATSGHIALQISQQHVNTPVEFTVLKRATFTGISPEKGYRKGQVTLIGTNFGTQIEGIIVLFGDKQATVVSCNNEAIVVNIPEDVELGDNTVLLQTLYETLTTTQTFKVLATPTVISVSPASGYVGGEITITGTNFSTSINDIKVLFGEKVAEILSATSTEIKAKIPSPNDGIFGEADLSVSISNLEIYKGKFTINNTPTVTRANSSNALNEELVIAGDEVTIAGVGLASSAVKVYFGSKEATPVSITETEVKVIVPNDINDGNITLKFDGIPTVVDGGKLQLLENGLDITKYVLQNSVQPFIDAEGSRSGNYATPASWTLNSAAFNCTKVPSASGIQGTGNASLLSVQAGWDFGSMDNGKIYQDINLPKGNYQFTLDVSECGNSSGRFAVYFVVAKGVNSIPNIVLNTWVLENTDNVLGSYRITDNKTAHHKDLDVISLNEKTQLSVGLVAQLTNQGWVKLSAIKVIWKD